MSNQDSRFSHKPCGTMRILWLALIYPQSWRERSCDEVIDHERGVGFQLTQEEQYLMIELSKLMEEMRLNAGVSIWGASQFFKWPRVRAVRDRAYAAFSARRHGNDSEWRRLAEMERGELAEWIEQVWRMADRPSESERR